VWPEGNNRFQVGPDFSGRPKPLTPEQKLRQKVLRRLKNLTRSNASKGLSRRRIVHLRVRHRAEVKEQNVEMERFAENLKITVKQIKNQSHVDGFFSCRVIGHYEFSLEGQTVSAALYVEVLNCLRDRVWRATGNVGGNEMDSPPQCSRALCINRA
jgi:hypothetical protein